MYCSGCGQQVEANAQICPRCGRPVAAAPMAAGTSTAGPAGRAVYAMRPYDRVRRHLQTVGILWVVFAVWSVLQWLLAASFLAGMFGGMAHHWGRGYGPFGDSFPFGHMPWFLPFVTTLVVLRAALSLVTGLALMRRAPWARTLALVTAFLTLIKPITGTILAIYTLWVLLPAYSGAEYEQISANSAVGLPG